MADAAVTKDALERAGRTLWQGFIVDGLVMAGIGVGDMLTNADITSGAFWTAAGLLVGKSLLVSAASYLARLKVAPKAS